MNAPSLRVVRAHHPEVAILPTAPDRQVQQPWNRANRAERAKLRSESPFAERYQHPQQREAMKRAEVMREVGQTPELIVLLSILETLDRDTRLAMVERLAWRAVAKPVFRQALEIIRSTTLNLGEQMDLARALDTLTGEAGA